MRGCGKREWVGGSDLPFTHGRGVNDAEGEERGSRAASGRRAQVPVSSAGCVGVVSGADGAVCWGAEVDSAMPVGPGGLS